MDQRIETYLDAATSGLKDDPELRLDVRAELATHKNSTKRGRRARSTAASTIQRGGAPPPS